ncbi:uncharacterized protein F4817DRAFT_332355 [Daldinia loculata]|uniref:uncharacterized protein n=1 Tax=Daldinia loculata TaxID=103429 RepID=UPI0020C5B041|nr:uncharacterized protein F4817DRAFT_332355 [Daldinia loculata]KAI1648943.1 hypothetical protein F4817DRAFT_332355 [Daldinia loculata]
MPSDNDINPPFDDSSPSDLTTNPPWPLVSRNQQTQIERTYFEDGATIHFERLPRLQFWAPLFFMKESFRVVYVTGKAVQASKLSQRRLTADEVNATSEAAANSARFLTWIHPVSLITTSIICWRTRKTFKFPLYQPKKRKFNPFTFPSKRLPIFTGASAVFAWHVSRFFCYLPFTLVGSLIFFTSVAESSYDAHLSRDPRLKNWLADVRRIHLNRLARMQRENQGPQRSFPGLPDPDSQSSQRTPVPQSPRDKYSSESENEAPREYGHDTFTGQSESSPNGLASEASRSPSTSSSQSYWGKEIQSQAPPSKSQDTVYSDSGSQHSEDDLDLFDDDDASPVPAALRKAEAQQTRDGQGGSAWDRIRQQQSQSRSAQWARGDSSGQERGWGRLRQDRTQNPRDSQPKTEGFAYTKQDEDKENKTYEKEQAQKEFDALLEAERRGGSNGG